MPASGALRHAKSRGGNGKPVRKGTWDIDRFLADGLDLPRHPAFLARLLALAEAFDRGAMRERLQRELVGSGEYSIEECQPGKAIFFPENECNLQYALKLSSRENNETIKGVVNARLFPDADAAQRYTGERLQPLASRAAGRSELAPYLHPVAVLEDLGMAAAVFPLDGEIPTLLDVTESETMLQTFREVLLESKAGNLTVEGFRLEPAHYGRYRRAVMRYRVRARVGRTGDIQEIPVYGKVDADGHGARTMHVLWELHDDLRRDGRGPAVRIPRPLAYLPDRRMLLMEALPGDPGSKRLLRDRMSGGTAEQVSGDALTLEEAIENCGLIAAVLHGSGLTLGGQHTLEDEVDDLRREVAWVGEMAAGFGTWLAERLEKAEAAASSSEPLPLRFSHGDFRYTQLLFAGKEGGLVDFDTICQAEPALDLGQFLAYQRLTIQKEQPAERPFAEEAAEALCERFLGSYLEAGRGWIGDEGALRARVRVYEVLSLLRLAVHSWQKLKGSRLQAAVQVLEERIACLPQVS